jgi:effector-binding domain-containing protein
VREALAGAVKAAAAAFKGTHPGLARALKGVLEELEETGLFD